MSIGKITIGIFNAIKRLQADGASYNEVHDYFGVSSATISYIFKAENFEEYRNILCENARRKAQRRAIAAKENAKSEEARKAEEAPQTVHHQVTVQATHYMQEELRKQTELLTLISSKLAFIVDELTK